MQSRSSLVVRSAGVALAALLAALGCQNTPVEPYTPTAPVPAGLPVSLTQLRRDPNGPIPEPTSIGAAGDSVVVQVTLENNCARWSPRAGVERGRLVVTAVDSMPREGRICAAIASSGPFRLVVRPAPSGRYEVAVRSRMYWPDARATEAEYGRARVTVR